jgi:hypothetical protein
MPSAISKHNKNRRSTRKNSAVNRPQPTTPISIAPGGASAAGSVITIEFNQPVILNGVPQYSTDVAGATPISAVMTNATTLELTFSASVAAATEITIPYEEPGIRNSSGGFVSTSTFPV